MEYCSKCIYSELVPNIIFDDRGVCNYCHQIDQYIKYADNLGVDFVLVEKIQIAPGLTSDWLPPSEFPQYTNYSSSASSSPSAVSSACQRLYTDMTINYDGRVSPCCLTYDHLSDFTRPSSPYFSLNDIWNNNLYRSARSSFSQKSKSEHTICHDCQNKLGSSELTHYKDTFAISLASGN